MKTLRTPAFTFIELLLAVAIIGTLAALVLPHLVGRQETAKVNAAKAAVYTCLPLAIETYETAHGTLPDSLADLGKPSLDPWGREYVYTRTGDQSKEYELCSKGQDEARPDDDICNAIRNETIR